MLPYNTDLVDERLHDGPVDLDLLGLGTEHLVELERLGDARHRLLLDADLPRVGTVHHAVAAGVPLRVVQRATSVNIGIYDVQYKYQEDL